LDVYIISLSRVGLDDSSLSELVNALPERCVALMEDIDAAFTHGVNRAEDPVPGSGNAAKPATPGTPAPVASTSKWVFLISNAAFFLLLMRMHTD